MGGLKREKEFSKTGAKEKRDCHTMSAEGKGKE